MSGCWATAASRCNGWSASRGQLNAKDENGVVRLEGTQSNFEGTLKIKGEVLSIGSDRFVLRGTILILDAPDKGRRCERTGDYEFRATGKRNTGACRRWKPAAV